VNLEALSDYFTGLQQRIVAALEALDGGKMEPLAGRNG